MRVLITGSTGLVGKRLVKALLEHGETVLPLSRREVTDWPTGQVEPLTGDPCVPGAWQERVADCDAVVHLAGEPIAAKRWNEKVIADIRRSRVDSTLLLAKTLARQPQGHNGTRKAFISTSAIGYYGDTADDRVYTEADTPGRGVMAGVARDWEAAADAARAAGVRVVHPRFGIVLDPDGGALPQMALPFKLFAGGRIGSGRQMLSWIHHADLTALLLFALDTPALQGVYNAVAPNPVSNAEFSRVLATVLKRPNYLPVPKFALRLLMGEVANVLAGGQSVSSAKIEATGFQFRYATLEAALTQALESQRN